MDISAKFIAEHIDGEVVGNPDVRVDSIARIEHGKPNNLCFLANPKYTPYLYETKAGIVLLNKTFELTAPVESCLIKVDDAYQAIAIMLDVFNNMKARNKRGRALSARISWSAKIGKNSYVGSSSYVGKHTVIGSGTQIYPHTYIADYVTIGDNTTIFPGVKIYPGCKIGSNCVIHANVVIGADGFGFAPLPDGSYRKIPQTGNVVIEDDVEIGANTTIDRATIGSTIIRRGVKLDNLIQVAHNVEIGENTVIAAQAGIAGSSKIGRSCKIGGQVGIAGHITIADNTHIGAQAGVLGSVREEGQNLLGSPAFDYKEYLKSYAIFRKLFKR